MVHRLNTGIWRRARALCEAERTDGHVWTSGALATLLLADGLIVVTEIEKAVYYDRARIIAGKIPDAHRT